SLSCPTRRSSDLAVRAAGETVREAVTEGREREVAMRDQLFRARNATCVGRDDGRATSGGPSRTYAVRAGRPGWCVLYRAGACDARQHTRSKSWCCREGQKGLRSWRPVATDFRW